MKKYLIEYENMFWCGGNMNVVVNASSPEEAMELADSHMDEEQRSLFSEEFEEALEDDPNFDDSATYIVNSVEELTPKHEDWGFYMDPDQAAFYPEIN